MIALIKEGNNCDYCEFVINREDELAELKVSFNGNIIGHGSTALCLTNKLVYFYDAESLSWIQF